MKLYLDLSAVSIAASIASLCVLCIAARRVFSLVHELRASVATLVALEHQRQDLIVERALEQAIQYVQAETEGKVVRLRKAT